MLMENDVRCVRLLSSSLAVAALTVVVHASQEPPFGARPDPPAPSRLTVAFSADAASVVPGRSVTLRLAMTPAAGIHVYAPGNADYIPVSVTLELPAGVQADPAVYPPGEDYVFGELKEIVKVYTRPFEVRQRITVTRAAARAAGSALTIDGSVRYQACTDKVCFPPATAPVSLTVPIASAQGKAAPR
jgi:DsbC/DsbD-like thiol-disulfide interchange protein